MRTKIITTIGPSTWDPKILKKLFKSGATAARVNSAFADRAELKRVKDTVHSINENIPLIMDTVGHKIRLTKIKEEIQLKTNQEVKISGRHSGADTILVDYKNFDKDVAKGHTILIDDGTIQLKVTAKTKDGVVAKVTQPGILKPAKTVNLPDTKLSFPLLTKKDKESLKHAIELGYDYVGLSFTRNSKDVEEIRKMIGPKPVGIIAKIENPEGIKNAKSIVQKADALLIARGDLGVETPYYQMPVLQKKLSTLGAVYGKPVIVATQMLESMRENLRPTRAEVTDIANAVFDRNDVLLLSAETSTGKHPIEAVKAMSKITQTTEKHFWLDLAPTISQFKKMEIDHYSRTIIDAMQKSNSDYMIYIAPVNLKSHMTVKELVQLLRPLYFLAKTRVRPYVFFVSPFKHFNRILNLLYNTFAVDFPVKRDMDGQAAQKIIKQGKKQYPAFQNTSLKSGIIIQDKEIRVLI